MRKKLKNLARTYGETQEQAIMRWGVQAGRDLAKYTQVFGNKPKVHKKAMFHDANNVIFIYEGRSKKTKLGYQVEKKGKKFYVPSTRFLSNESEVLEWIEQNRKGKNNRTKRLPIDRCKVCSRSLLRRAINQKYKQTAGSAKDGWLDAADEIAKRQKGRNPARIGASFMRFARKKKRQGTAKTRKGLARSTGELTNRLPYVRSRYVLKNSHKRRAIRDSMRNTLKWYRAAIRAENRKKK